MFVAGNRVYSRAEVTIGETIEIGGCDYGVKAAVIHTGSFEYGHYFTVIKTAHEYLCVNDCTISHHHVPDWGCAYVILCEKKDMYPTPAANIMLLDNLSNNTCGNVKKLTKSKMDRKVYQAEWARTKREKAKTINHTNSLSQNSVPSHVDLKPVSIEFADMWFLTCSERVARKGSKLLL